MDVNELYILYLFILGKNKQQGYASPSDFNTNINAAAKQYASYLLGSVGQYTPGRPVAKVELGQNSVVRQNLAPIIYGYNLNVDSTGFSPFPTDYVQTDAMWSIYGYQRIRYADQHKFVSIYNSRIDPIATNPIYILEDAGFRFFPQNTANAKLHYVKDPPNMIWGYDEDINGIPVYNAARSSQPVWDSLALMEIMSRAMSICGIRLQSSAVLAYSKEMQNNDK